MNLSNRIRHHAELTPEKPAIVFEGETLSYAGLADLIDRYALILSQGIGIGAGERVAYLGFNSPFMLALLFACARIGAILLPLNWRMAGPEHIQLLRHAKPRVLFVSDDFIHHVDSMRVAINSLTLVCMAEASQGWLSLPRLEQEVHAQTGCEVPAGTGEQKDEDGAVLLCYTSGTTGVPKGALLSQKALWVNALNSIDMHDLSGDDTVLTLLPMFHVGGLNIQTLPALIAGATVVIHRQFDVDLFYQALSTQNISLTLVVPTVLLALMADERWSRDGPTRLRMMSIGSTIVPASLVTTVCEWGVPLVQVYGSTETCPIAAYTPPADAARKPASTGKTAKHCELRIVDANGATLVSGQSGEILVRGPNVMLEYWCDEEATRQVFSDGRWLHTGDIGHFDEEGFLYVDERLKDMIISGGENVYPAQIENLLVACKEIEEVAVVGRPDDYWGEVVVAVVVEKPGCKVDATLVRDFCEGRIAHFSCPREVVVIKQLPRNVMGKVLKDEVRQQVIEHIAAQASQPTTRST